MRIDVHNHLLPDPYVDLLLEWDTPVGLTSENGDLYMVHQRSGTASVAAGNAFQVNSGFLDVETRLEWMEQHNVERTLASVSTPNPIHEAFTPEQSTQLIRAINDGFADLQSRYPDRLGGLGMLPLREPEVAIAEVDRIAADLELDGIALPASVNGNKLSAPELKPVFDRLDESGLTAFVHPHGNVLSDELGDDESFLNPLVVFPTETTFQVARLIYDGFFDDHDFDVVLSHMGGALLQLAGRLNRGRDEIDDSEARPDKPVIEYVREFHYDAISFHRPALAAAIDTVGVEQFVFGTDFPFDEEDTQTLVADIETVVESEADRERLMHSNAAELFDL